MKHDKYGSDFARLQLQGMFDHLTKFYHIWVIHSSFWDTACCYVTITYEIRLKRGFTVPCLCKAPKCGLVSTFQCSEELVMHRL